MAKAVVGSCFPSPVPPEAADKSAKVVNAVVIAYGDIGWIAKGSQSTLQERKASKPTP